MRALHAVLNGEECLDSELSWLLTVSRVCEEYGCLPSHARFELENDPEQLAIRILPLRAYIRAKNIFDSAKSRMDLPVGDPIIDLVEENEFEIAAEGLGRNLDD